MGCLGEHVEHVLDVLEHDVRLLEVCFGERDGYGGDGHAGAFGALDPTGRVLDGQAALGRGLEAFGGGLEGFGVGFVFVVSFLAGEVREAVEEVARDEGEVRAACPRADGHAEPARVDAFDDVFGPGVKAGFADAFERGLLEIREAFDQRGGGVEAFLLHEGADDGLASCSLPEVDLAWRDGHVEGGEHELVRDGVQLDAASEHPVEVEHDGVDAFCGHGGAHAGEGKGFAGGFLLLRRGSVRQGIDTEHTI